MKKALLIVALFAFGFSGDMGLGLYGGLSMTNVSYGDEFAEIIADEATETTSDMAIGGHFGVNYSLADMLPVPLMVGAGISMRGNSLSWEVAATEDTPGSCSDGVSADQTTCEANMTCGDASDEACVWTDMVAGDAAYTAESNNAFMYGDLSIGISK